MTIYAVIKTGGKQYKVAPGDVVKVEKLAVAAGATVEFREVYLLANAQGITTGNPIITSARVVAEVVGEGRDDKIHVFKKRRRKNYRKTIGHRQYFTMLRINEIALGSDVHKAKATIPRDTVRTEIESTVAETSPRKSAAPETSTAKSVPEEKTPTPIAATPSKPESQVRSDRHVGVIPNTEDPTAIAETATLHTEPPAQVPEPIAIEREPAHLAAQTDDAPAQIPIETTKQEIPAPAESDTGDTQNVDTFIPADSFAPPADQEIRKRDMPAIELSGETESRSRSNMRYWILLALIVTLLSGIVMLFLGDLGRRTPENAVPVAVEPQATPVAPTLPKAKPAVRDIKIKKTGAGAAPSAPAQPPD